MQAVDHLVENGYQELNESIRRIKTRTHIQRYTVDKAVAKPKPQIQIPADYKKRRDPALLEYLKQKGLDSPVQLKVLDDFEAAVAQAEKGLVFSEKKSALPPLAQQYTWEHLVPGYSDSNAYRGRQYKQLIPGEAN
jgi:hypothetical protein